MKKKLSAGLIIFCFLIFVGAVFVLEKSNQQRQITPQENQVAENKAKLEIFTPSVFVQNPGSTEWALVAEGAEITESQKIKTDEKGSAQIVYPDGSVTRLAESSQITITKLDLENKNVSIKVDIGKVWSRVTRLFGSESYQTESENLVASIRGTSYGHQVLANGEDLLTVTKSKVQGKCKAKNIESEVTKDFKGIFNCKKGLRPRIARQLAREKLEKWYQHNENEDKKQVERFGIDKFNDLIPNATSPSPTIYIKPSPSFTPSPSPTPTSTPSTAPSPSPSASPTPMPTIISISTPQPCYNYSSCTVNITGSGLDKVTTAYAVNKADGSTYQVSITPQSESRMTVTYNGPSGDFYIKIINIYGGAVTSPGTFQVIYFG